MGTLLRAMLEGFGWHVGREAAKDAIDAVDRGLEAEAAAKDPKARAKAREASKKAATRAAKVRAAEGKRAAKEIEAELRRLKERVKG